MDDRDLDEESCGLDSSGEGSDRESESLKNETANEKDGEELASTASAGQSMPEPGPTNTSDRTPDICSSTYFVYLLRVVLSTTNPYDLAPDAVELVTTNEPHFTMDTIPSRRG